MRIRLIGSPQVTDDDGVVVPVRGHQPWALLARVLLAERPVTRRELAAELFPETVDPLGSVRWCLAAVRRALGAPDFLTGDPLRADLPDGVTADVRDLAEGRLEPTAVGELLEGVDARGSVELDLWLLVQRQRVASRVDALLRREVMVAAARSDVDRALALAEVAARRRPLDEGTQILLVAGLRQAGRHEAAATAVDEIEARFVAELGAPPSPALRSAVRPDVAAAPPGVPPRARAVTLLEAGEAALAAGAVDAGLESLRQAVRLAEECGDDRVLGTSLRALGAALVHAVRSHDDKGALLLERAAAVALDADDPGTAASAHRELAYVDALAGRRPAAQEHLGRAESLADDPDLLAAVRSVRAFNLTDWGRHDAALDEWEQALDLARSTGNRRRLAWALGLGGWGRLRAGRPDDARPWLRECLDVVREAGWVSFRPWPQAVLAEVELTAGRAGRVPDLQEAFALSCQLSDPCWEGSTARALALSALAAGDAAEACRWVDEAGRRVARETDVYVAMQAAILATDVEVSARLGDEERLASRARSLLELAARAHLDDHVACAADLLRRTGGSGGGR
ncbi:tetratricopeptide repeat protein [Nocardioides sp. GCM10027113]|uniref:tetratricopeptide repeat protein n=1 Tax=unclassified Nocardioides TaxID=2615069 RepID=UPI003611B59B